MRMLISAILIGTITVLLLELVLRSVGTITPGGDWALSGLVVKPFHLPVQAAKAQVAEYLERGNSRIEYDPDLGWTARRSSKSIDGMYAYNSQRIRRPDDVAQVPNPSTLRILLLGDSLMHGDDVPYQDSLAALLESEFLKTDQSVEVLNLGMSGYGIDQAVFRYIKEGRSFAPQIVILGF